MSDRGKGQRREGHVGLPEGISVADWALEKNNWQNPRIRCLLGCIRLLDDVFESNFAILHCSPRRLREIWSGVCEVSNTIRTELAPLVAGRSKIPVLEGALRASAKAVDALDKGLLRQLDALPRKPKNTEMEPLRSVLCETVGRMHHVLMDVLGRIMEADPRSVADTDYFLSRQFAQDVDDAEWLHTSVQHLERYVARIDRFRTSSLSSVVDHIVSEQVLPSEGLWMTTRLFLDELRLHLVPQLQKMIGLRGIRIDELQIIEKFVHEIPELCAVIREIYDLGVETVQGLRDVGFQEGDSAMIAANMVITSRLVDRMGAVNDEIKKVAAFIPEWRSKLTERRALAFRRRQAEKRPGGG